MLFCVLALFEFTPPWPFWPPRLSAPELPPKPLVLLLPVVPPKPVVEPLPKVLAVPDPDELAKAFELLVLVFPLRPPELEPLPELVP